MLNRSKQAGHRRLYFLLQAGRVHSYHADSLPESCEKSICLQGQAKGRERRKPFYGVKTTRKKPAWSGGNCHDHMVVPLASAVSGGLTKVIPASVSRLLNPNR